MSTQARLDAIGIVVSDMAKTLDFYRQLGLRRAGSADGEGHVEVGAARWPAAAVRHRGRGPFLPPGLDAARGGRTGLAFALRRPGGRGRAARANWSAAGHHSELAPFDAFWGQRYAVVLDPDGNGVDLFAPLAS